MRVTRTTANRRVADVETAKAFYTDYLGLSIEEFNMGWVARYTSPETKAHVQLVTRDATAPEDSVISVHTDDLDGEAQRVDYEIVHPITTEAWGCAGSSSAHRSATHATSSSIGTETPAGRCR